MSSERWVKSPVLDTHMRGLLDELEPHAETIRHLLDRGLQARFFCFSQGSTTEPPSLPSETRYRAASLGLKIEIDHYQL